MNKKQKLIELLTNNPKSSRHLVQKLYELYEQQTLPNQETLSQLNSPSSTRTEQLLTLEQLFNHFEEETLNHLYAKYIENPTRRLWRWSLMFLGLMLGWVLFGGLTNLKVWL